MEIYYKINYNLFNNYEKNNINYELLKNINEIINNNEIVLNDIIEVINDNETTNSFNNLISIYNKMNNKNNIFEDNENNIKNQKNKIIAFYEIDNRKIKILGTEFVKNNKYNFDFFINGYLSNMRDELDKTFWNED